MRLSSFATIAALLICSATPAFAVDTYDCADAKGEVAVEFDLDSGDAPFNRVQMQISGDIGISTDPVYPDFDGEYISAQFTGEDFQGVDLSWKDENDRMHKAMSLRLVSAWHGDAIVIAGALSVDGGGVWAVTCTARAAR